MTQTSRSESAGAIETGNHLSGNECILAIDHGSSGTARTALTYIKMGNIATPVALAELFGVSKRTISDLAKRGMVVRAGGGYALADSVRRYCSHLRELAIGRGGESAIASATAERARLANAQAELVETKGRKLRGELVDAAEVEAEWSGVLRNVRAGCLAIPSRVQQRLPHLTAHDVVEIDSTTNGKSKMTRLRLQHVHVFCDRHGKVRHYFRRRGTKQIPLPGLPGSAEFMEAYQAALAGVVAPQKQIGASRTKPGTVSAAIVGYLPLARFSLAPGTQEMRRAILERFRDAHGDKRIATLPPPFIAHMLSRMKPAAARNWLKTLRGLLAFAVAEGFRADDPTLGLKLPPMKTDGIHAWTEDEIARFEVHFPIGTKARLAFALLPDTLQRRGDVVGMGPQHVKGGAIHVRQNKTGAPLAVAELSELASGARCDSLRSSDLPDNGARQAVHGGGLRQLVS